MEGYITATSYCSCGDNHSRMLARAIAEVYELITQVEAPVPEKGTRDDGALRERSARQ